MSVKHDITVKLTGEDGNAFNVIGLTARAIRRQVSPVAAQEYVTVAMESESYDALLALTQRTVHVL